MKQIYIFNASQVIESLSEKDNLSYNVLWDLFQLKNELKTHVDFFNKNLENLQKKYLPRANEQGQLTGEAYEDYMVEFNELANMDKDISDVNKPTIKLKDIPGMTLKMMDALNELVNFEKE